MSRRGLELLAKAARDRVNEPGRRVAWSLALLHGSDDLGGDIAQVTVVTARNEWLSLPQITSIGTAQAYWYKIVNLHTIHTLCADRRHMP